MELITSRQNALVKSLKKQIDSRRARRESGQVIAEGIHLFEIQRSVGVTPELIVIAERCQSRPEIAALIELSPASRIVVLSDDIFDQIAPADTPSGLLTVGKEPVADTADLQSVDTLVLDRVQDPGNVGSLIRTAVAAGVRQIVLSSGCADPWSPRCLRAGQGAQWLAKVFTEIDLNAFLDNFSGAVAATVLNGGSSLYEHPLTQVTAWLFGNEGQGVDPQLITHATQRITIPMPGGMESLNVNAAAAVCLFEQVRQRR